MIKLASSAVLLCSSPPQLPRMQCNAERRVIDEGNLLCLCAGYDHTVWGGGGMHAVYTNLLVEQVMGHVQMRHLRSQLTVALLSK